ncbi:MAG TPA: efflux RND transporter periplasmic adaptor subunit, partial [Alphaproteobacteria bacterium]|nr:efflux RND transporter periplasmic adaptor subunit [Alphaproteobacteria bacterium]
HDAAMLAAVDKAPNADNFRFFELRSPLKGRVIGRELMLGEYVDSTHSAYTVADLSVVWVEVGIAPGDLPFVKQGQVTSVIGDGLSAEGKLIVLSPVIDPETRLAKGIIELDNSSGQWPPGKFVNAAIATSSQDIKLVLPKEAVQSVDGKPAVFIRTDKGFEKRNITTGREDSRNIEVISGVKAGEIVAISSTFTLKAELGKTEAEHVH